MKYAFRFPQRSLHWGLFRVPKDGIISADSLGSDMLARRYTRGTAGRAVSVAPKKVARMLILILGTLGFNFACQGCHSQKSSAGPSHRVHPYSVDGTRWTKKSRHDLWTA